MNIILYESAPWPIMFKWKQKVNARNLMFLNLRNRFAAVKQSLMLAMALGLSGCGLSTSEDSTAFCPVVEEGAVAFVKRPLLFDEDEPDVFIGGDDLREPHAFRPGARLFIKGSLLVSDEAVDITSAVFSDPSFLNEDGELLYDVKDLAVSYDGTKLAFSIRAPEIEGADGEDQPKWNIYLYDFETCSLEPVIASNATAESGQDIMPAFLTDERLVFASTRQQVGKGILLDEGKPQYSGLDEELDFEAFNLHVMDYEGQQIDQLTFNQSHDLSPTLNPNGKIVFSRWDNAGGTAANGMNLYSINPDGTELSYLYGRHSHDSGEAGTTVQYARPTALENGNVLVQLREFQSTQLSGVPTEVDVDRFVEADQRTDGSSGVGQQALISGIDTSGELNLDGNYGTTFPFYDGTGRLLASFSICRVRTRAVDAVEGDPTSVALPVGEPEVCTQEKIDDTATYEPAPPAYGLWIVDGATQLPVVAPEEGQEFADAVLIASRSRPTFIAESMLDAEAQDLADQGFGVLHIRSVYDFDGIDRSPAGIATLADPVLTAPQDRPAQFVRIEKAVSIPPDYVREFDNSAFGRSHQQLMREILGYVPVEPDGSVKVTVPANVALSLSVLDENGRRMNGTERHQNWITVRPGETRTCFGCHSGASEIPHSRSDAGPESINVGALTTGLPFPNTEPALFADAGETMAEVYARVVGIRSLTSDVIYEDQWTNPLAIAKAASYAYLYEDLDTTVPIAAPACLDDWTSLCRIVVNYAEHIQPLWSADRRIFDVDGITLLDDNTCTLCHNNEDDMGAAMVPVAQLDLSNDPSTDEANHFLSYRNLLFVTAEQELDSGILRPILVGTGEFERNEDGELILDGAGDPIEILATIPVQPTMRTAGANASFRFFDKFEAGGTHTGYLSDAELRLISEWLDVGAQYWNDPFKAPIN